MDIKRFEIINKFIEENNYTSYLEIGTQGDICLSNVICDYKVGVDPKPVHHNEDNSDKFYEMTSNEFFMWNKETFDIIFIDGLHHSDQVVKDIINSLNILNDNGVILLHDCNPQSYKAQTVPETHMASWNGDVWRAFMWFRGTNDNLEMFTIDEDEGIGVIRFGSQNLVDFKKDVNYEELENNRKQWLNLINYEDVCMQGLWNRSED